MVRCNRCGACCKNCRQLMRLKNGKTFCRIYPNRLGYEVAKGVYCTYRALQYDADGKIEQFKDCPFN